MLYLSCLLVLEITELGKKVKVNPIFSALNRMFQTPNQTALFVKQRTFARLGKRRQLTQQQAAENLRFNKEPPRWFFSRPPLFPCIKNTFGVYCLQLSCWSIPVIIIGFAGKYLGEMFVFHSSIQLASRVFPPIKDASSGTNPDVPNSNYRSTVFRVNKIKKSLA